MKTAISIPDDLFVNADHLAQRMGLSRSELYATAIKDYLAQHRRDGLVDRINRVCDRTSTSVEIGLKRAQSKSLPHGEW